MVIDESWYRKPPGIDEHTSAGGVVVRVAGGRLLVALVCGGERPAYELPKGHVKPGESPEDAARREVAEEAGLTSLILLGALATRERLNYRKTSWKQTHYFLYIAAAPTEATAGRVEWFPLDALPPMFWPEQRELLDTQRPHIIDHVTRVSRG